VGPGDGFDDRYLQIGTTFGGATVIRGNLTPECAAAVRAATEALDKEAGPEDDRTETKRFHDALQLACAPLPRVRTVQSSICLAARLTWGQGAALVAVRIYTFSVRRGSWFGSLGGPGPVRERSPASCITADSSSSCHPSREGSSAWPHWS
jgi:hypothetical protein